MPVDQLEPAVGQFIGEQTAGEADLGVEIGQHGSLHGGMPASIQLVRHQVASADADMTDDAITHRQRQGFGHGIYLQVL